MPILLQIGFMAVAIALVAVCIVAIQALRRFGVAADEMAKAADAIVISMGQVSTITHEMRGALATFNELAPPLRRLSNQAEFIGSRALGLSNEVLDGVETSMKTAVAVAKGLVTGISQLKNRKRRPSGNGALAEEMMP